MLHKINIKMQLHNKVQQIIKFNKINYLCNIRGMSKNKEIQ
jgi:hypothetical protein